jgi:hypothetical protein
VTPVVRARIGTVERSSEAVLDQIGGNQGRNAGADDVGEKVTTIHASLL